MKKTKTAILIVSLMATLPVCRAQSVQKSANEKQNIVHKVLVREVIQTSNYTYLLGKENDSEKWLAVPLMEAKAGETYYYKGGWPMNKFESKELKRTFDDVLFLGGVSSNPDLTSQNNKGSNIASSAGGHNVNSDTYKRKAESQIKKDIKIETANDGITIAQLFSKKESYAGKKVKIKGEVIKYTPSIMNKNWIHLQDGTEYNKKFELTITSATEVKVGQVVTLEGKISLNKDLGYGYFFDVIMEEAVLK